MLQNLQQFYGKKLGAVDGHIGHVKDFYFDDQSWAIRYLVADTGPWLSGRQVLLPPHVFDARALERAVAADNDLLHVNLTRRQIERSPSIDLHRPVSRQYEEAYHRYYDWPFYWARGGGDDHLTTEPLRQETLPQPGEDAHLRSTQAVTGYRVQATDGAVGSVSGFMIHGRDWTIHELTVKTDREHGDEEVCLLAERIDRISYEEAVVFLKLAKGDISQMVGDPIVST